MPGPLPTNPVALGYRAYTLWRKLPPAKRRALLKAARANGPRVATVLAAAAKAARKR